MLANITLALLATARRGMMEGLTQTRSNVQIAQRRFELPKMGIYLYRYIMRIMSVSTLQAFYQKPEYSGSEQVIKTWVHITKSADWVTPIDVKKDFGQTDILKDGRAVFDLGGNKYRLVAWINYTFKVVYIRFIGTHAEYDEIDAETV